MRELYPRYKTGELELIYKKLTEQEQTTIKEFITYCGSSAGKRKLGDIQRSIVQFRHILDKNIELITLKDLRDYLQLLNHSDRLTYTRNGLKAHIKKFLRWKFRDWPIRFDELRDIKSKKIKINEQKINDTTLLKKEQIDAILTAEESLIRKTFFLTLYESGARPGELSQIKWKNIKFEVKEGLSEIFIYAPKTEKARTVYVQQATHLLQQLRKRTPKEQTYVFSSIYKGKEKPIAKVTSGRWVQDMGKKIGLNIYPYLLRHTRATELYLLAKQNKISKDAVLAFMGHSEDMEEVYTHLSTDQVKAITKTVYQTEELAPEKKHALELELESLKAKHEHLTDTVFKLMQSIPSRA